MCHQLRLIEGAQLDLSGHQLHHQQLNILLHFPLPVQFLREQVQLDIVGFAARNFVI